MIPLGLITLVLVIWGLQLIQSRLYKFPDPQPFVGEELYNPYAGLEGLWLKCNVHAHAYTHLGLTNGKQPGNEILEHYRSLGYDISAISDYHSINKHQNTSAPSFIPFYEHGYNANKTHQLVSSMHVSPFDLAFNLNRSNKQYVIDRLKWHAPLVILAHPALQKSYSENELRYLAGYDAMEVLNHYRQSIRHWNAALSAGKPVWIFANDDSHNIDNPNETGVNWTMINIDVLNHKNFIDAVKHGQTYGVNGRQGMNDNELEYVRVRDMSIEYAFANPADSIRLVGQDGLIRARYYNSHTALYSFTHADTYIRAEIFNPRSSMYLNPVIRYDGNAIPSNVLTARVQWNRTIVMRALITSFYLIFLGYLLKAPLYRLYSRHYLPGYRWAKSLWAH